MEAQFWHNAWDKGKTGWQQRSASSRLQQHWSVLGLPAGAKVLVPLCGDSVDMLWLREQGCQVVGCELNEAAVQQFFEQNFADRKVAVSQSPDTGHKVYQVEGVCIYCGDFFALKAAQLGRIDAAYDRAATVAMSPDMRPGYAKKMQDLVSPGASVLLIAWDYDEKKMEGPPFSIPREEVDRLYGNGFAVSALSAHSGPEHRGNLADRGLDTLTETAYRMVRHPPSRPN